ncbi:hypothetical protein [Deinococcus radiophilus]
MPSKPVVRHHHPGPNPKGDKALAAAGAVVMRRAMEGLRRDGDPYLGHVTTGSGQAISSPEAQTALAQA